MPGKFDSLVAQVALTVEGRPEIGKFFAWHSLAGESVMMALITATTRSVLLVRA